MTGEWLTYAQIGERFGLKAEAARTRVRRLGWRTMAGMTAAPSPWFPRTLI